MPRVGPRVPGQHEPWPIEGYPPAAAVAVEQVVEVVAEPVYGPDETTTEEVVSDA